MSRFVDKIIIHCSASPDYLDIGAREIDRWHKERGFNQIGYHYVVRRNGEVERGRPEYLPGAHAKGANKSSIGIVWIGEKSISPEQEKSLIGLINLVRGQYHVKVENVLGHREAVQTSKTCPNLDMNRLRAELVFIHPFPEVR